MGKALKTIPTEVFLHVKPMIVMLHNTGLVEDPGVAGSKQECFRKMVDMILLEANIYYHGTKAGIPLPACAGLPFRLKAL